MRRDHKPSSDATTTSLPSRRRAIASDLVTAASSAPLAAVRARSPLRDTAAVQQLTAQDASFLYTETPKAPMSGGGLAIYDPSTAPEKVTLKGS